MDVEQSCPAVEPIPQLGGGDLRAELYGPRSVGPADGVDPQIARPRHRGGCGIGSVPSTSGKEDVDKSIVLH